MLQDAGQSGQIIAEQCTILPDVIKDICICKDIAGSPVSAETPGDTPAPADAGPVAFSASESQTPDMGPVALPTAAPDASGSPVADPGGSAPPVAGTPCSVCGDGRVVGNPDALFESQGQSSMLCGTLQDGGNAGQISAENCDFLPDLISDVCSCTTATKGPGSTAPASPQAQVSSSTPPSPPVPAVDGTCSVCGDGLAVGIPDAIFEFPGQPTLPCSTLESAGANGLITPDQCQLLPSLIKNLCGCAPKTASTSPVYTVTAPPSSVVSMAPDAPSNAAPVLAPEEGGCSICGDGLAVGKPDAIFEFPGQPTVSCSTLENAGATGVLPADKCALLPNLILDTCGCAPNTSSTSPISTGTTSPFSAASSTPNSPVIAAPVAPAQGGCSVCGDGLEVGKPDAIFSVPGQPSVVCSRLQTAGATGIIVLDQCELLPDLIVDVCGCIPIRGTSSPSSAATLAPTSHVTAAPAPGPANAPVPAPVDSPVIAAPTTDAGNVCNVCGDGLAVGIPDAIFEFPSQPTLPCSILETAGQDGLIPAEQCKFLPSLLKDLCGCEPRSSTSSSAPAPPLSS